MKFTLNRKDHNMTRKYIPASSIIEHIYCSNANCGNRDNSKLSIGFSKIGIQIYCDNCEESVLHIQLQGDLLADTCKQGKFNKRNGRGSQEKYSKFTVSTESLMRLEKEEEAIMDAEERGEY